MDVRRGALRAGHRDAAKRLRGPVEYPTRDGRPMGETDQHRIELADYAVGVLTAHFAADPLVYVSGNNFIYWTEGEPADVVSPDTYVVKGVPKGPHDTFKVWEEGGRRPSFVLEITSRSTRREDLGRKMSTYRDDLRVPEYFLFDPRREWLDGGLRGYALRGGVYRPIRPTRSGRLISRQLGLELAVDGGHLRFFLPGVERPLPTTGERAEAERERAEAERERAEAERQRAEAERERAERAEAAVVELRAELERLRRAARKRGPGGAS